MSSKKWVNYIYKELLKMALTLFSLFSKQIFDNRIKDLGLRTNKSYSQNVPGCSKMPDPTSGIVKREISV